ncbi:hypothetical protein BKA70DRAFT_1572055 [Coprinopsis sp. MPI-PUGE-AT-0042]|nr:hypothetical protein BKA70DRAFT_1572055 [Coprinopsis sp. MPI-PUGE-AT-0042]
MSSSSFASSATRPRRRLTTALVFLCFIAGYVRAQVEVPVDDNNPAIVYSPSISWFRNEETNPMDAGGFHMVTTDTAASAEFRFTGTGISYMAPLWAEEITTQVRLDGGVPVVIDLQDKTVTPEVDGPTTVESSVLWSEKGLTNTEHVLIIDVAPGGRFAVVDQLIVEQDGTSTTDTTTETTATDTATETTSETPTTSSRTRPAAATSPTASPTPATITGLTITIAVVCSVAGALIILLALLFFLRRRRHRREREAWGRMNPALPPGPPPPPMDTIDDGINAPPKQRFRSIPSRNGTLAKMYMAAPGDESPDNMSQVNTPTAASGRAGAASKLRQVVAATEDGNRQSWVPPPEIVQTSRRT